MAITLNQRLTLRFSLWLDRGNNLVPIPAEGPFTGVGKSFVGVGSSIALYGRDIGTMVADCHGVGHLVMTEVAVT